MRLNYNPSKDFKPYGCKLNTVKLQSLSSWGSLEKADTRILISNNATPDAGSPFPLSKEINDRFIIWDGDITDLEVDVITNTRDEYVNGGGSLIFNRILSIAGNKLKEELNSSVEALQHGEVLVTKGYELPSKYVLHTITPTFNNKYNTTIENNLHCFYRNILSKAKELKLQTIAVNSINSRQKDLSPDVEAHIALRTIRRFLDKSASQIVILCVHPYNRGVYEVLAPLYFPRDLLEERSALQQLPKDIGCEFGEPCHPERHIRIIRNPQHSVIMRHTDDDCDNNLHEMDSHGSDVECSLSELNGLSLNSRSAQARSYAQMQGDLDRQRLLGNRAGSGMYETVISEGIETVEHQNRFA